jgi:hypothetical protein
VNLSALRFFILRLAISPSLGQVSSATRSSIPAPDNARIEDRATPDCAPAKSFFEQHRRSETFVGYWLLSVSFWQTKSRSQEASS